jgi:hypothetical protein
MVDSVGEEASLSLVPVRVVMVAAEVTDLARSLIDGVCTDCITGEADAQARDLGFMSSLRIGNEKLICFNLPEMNRKCNL